MLISSRSVSASKISIPNSDVQYETWYQTPGTNHWEVFDNSVDGFIPNSQINVRLRLYLPDTQNINQPYNITFTLVHNPSDISLVTMNVLDQQGNIMSGDNVHYDGYSIKTNATLQRSIISINGFYCSTSSWVTLTFVYNTATTTVPNTSNAYIQASVQYFSIDTTSIDALLGQMRVFLDSAFGDLIAASNANSQAIVDAVDDGNDSILDAIGGLGMDVLEGIADTMTTVENAVDDLQDGILGGLSSLGSSILGGLTSLGEFVVDGIYDLFVPDGDDLQEWISDFQDALYEECPLLGDVIAIFTRLVQFVVTGTQIDSYYVPETTLEFGDATITLGGWDVPLLPDGLDDYIDYVRLFTSLLVGIAFLFMFYHKLLNIFGIESVEEVEHELDWYLHKADQYNLSSRHMDDFWGDEEI